MTKSRLSKSLARCAGLLLAGLAVVLGTSGCASYRPAPLMVQHQALAAPTNCPDHGLSLKVVTYNIWGLPSWMTGSRPGRYPKIARELEQLDPDIVLLQEAWTAKARKAAPANGRWQIARGAGQHTFFQQNGLMTLSKCPIIGGEFYPFPRAASWDRFVNKGILKVTVQLAGGEVLNIWNVHLQEGGPIEVRRAQVRELVSRVQAAEDGQIADLIGGDFNCTPKSPLFRELASSLGPSVHQLGNAEPFITWDGLSAKPGAGRTLDYIFVRQRAILRNPQAAPRVAFAAPRLEHRLSDHLGIEAVLNLEVPFSVADAGGSRMEHLLLPTVGSGRAESGGVD